MVNISAVVGTAYVRLRLLTDSIGKDIKSAVGKSDFQDIDVKVNADTLEADAELKATGEEADKLGRKSPTITPKVNSKDAQKQTNLLKDALILLGPAVGPLAGAATAAMGGLAAGAGVALLAVQGVKKEMKAGTDVGNQFRGGIQSLTKNLNTLETTAAKAVLPGFSQTVSELNTLMPSVNRSVGILGKELGDISAHVVVGLVGGLKTFEPLLLHVGQAADIAARHFQDWATSTGGGNFANTLGASFDKVIPILASLAQAVGKLIAAFTPIGSQVVGVLGALADTINALPLPVLQALATAFVSLYAANKLAGVFASLSRALGGLGTSASLAGTKVGGLALSAQSLTKFAGVAAASGLAAYSLGKSISGFLEAGNAGIKVLDNMTTANSDFFNSLIQSKGALDDTVTSTVQYQLSQDGLTKKAAKAGISQDQLTQAITGTDEQTQALIDTWKKSGSPASSTLFAIQALHEGYQQSAVSAAEYNAKLDALAKSPAWGALKTSKDSVQQVADKFHLSADSVKNFASLVGISETAIKNGVVTNKQLADSVQTVASAYNTATATGSGFLDSLQKFSTSAGTAADRAQLIGAYLKASQGDLLSYSGAVASAFQANMALTNSFKQQTDQVKAGTLALADTERAAINLKTGLIDTSKAGAGPLIQQLQAMQDAAMAAASATYQHEVATKGAGKAAADAADIFKNQTYNALVADAKQLGLTKTEAEKLATAYFDVPKDVKTKVKAIGTDPVVTVLHEIEDVLLSLAHMSPHPKVSVTDNASTQINKIQQNLRALKDKTIDISTYVQNVILPDVVGQTRRKSARGDWQGGPVVGPGSGTSDSIPTMVSNGEYIIRASQAARYRPLLDSINSGRGGYAAGGMVGGGSGGPGWSLDSLLAEIRMLAAAVADRPVQLVASNGGLPLAKVVNDANLKNARRMG